MKVELKEAREEGYTYYESRVSEEKVTKKEVVNRKANAGKKDNKIYVIQRKNEDWETAFQRTLNTNDCLNDFL
jgi:hypothetical protein